MAAAKFPQTPKSGSATSASAHTLLNGTTNLVLLLTAGSTGAVVTRVDAKPLATIAACPAYLYRSTDAGSTVQLLRAKTVAAGTVSTSLAPVEQDFGYSESAPLRMQASERLYVGHATTVNLGWSAEATDF